MSTRPRISFDSRGWCNACQWMEEKPSVDWVSREKELKKLLEKHRGNSEFDCVVAVSGGKDGSYVAHTLKTKYGVNPLCVTVRPPLSMEIGDQNLVNFINSGFEHIHVSVNQEATRVLDTIGFKEYGQGYYGWLIAIHTTVLRIAKNFGISLVFYSEDGEIEYGGGTARKNIPTYGIDYMKAAYLNQTYEDVMQQSMLTQSEKYWFEFPEQLFDGMEDFEVTHFSYFEAWDSYRNYVVAKEHCGLKELETGVEGTFTNFAQNDQELASLHYYLMYLKFGFGRATQDAGIEIRRGSMTRDQAVNLVKLYDNVSLVQFYSNYCEYYQVSMKEFEGVLDRFANKRLFKKVDGVWKPKFVVAEDLVL